jgi:hypothetical protein
MGTKLLISHWPKTVHPHSYTDPTEGFDRLLGMKSLVTATVAFGTRSQKGERWPVRNQGRQTDAKVQISTGGQLATESPIGKLVC